MKRIATIGSSWIRVILRIWWVYLICLLQLYSITEVQMVKNLPAIWETWVRSPWRRAWQPTPVFLPGEFHGQSNLEGYSPWSRIKSDMRHFTFTFVSNRTLLRWSGLIYTELKEKFKQTNCKKKKNSYSKKLMN